MNKEQRIVYIQSQILCAYTQTEGMKAANAQRAIVGDSPAYTEAHFDSVIDGFGLGSNAVIKFLMEGE